ncbi:EcsC family protein [Cohnella sp. AR92]|uniref:EcsC family protein n=1 Tax=Cohnella sp. AR92 TaxID=648716 RepID=UPI000F8CD57F|nr:EcsC family protein [Cohnella sp. AR92]RUS44954.1 EcsC family protein [Cohnella sp. AR92]
MAKLNQEVIVKALDWAYDKALNGLPGTDNAEELAENYLRKAKSIDEAVDSLIRWQTSYSASSGFLTGLGGIVTLPVAIPANLASVLYVQLRMIAAIAHLGGYDLRDDKVKAFVIMCLCGNEVKEILKRCGIVIGNKLAKAAINMISGAVITKINQKVGFRLLTKFGSKGAINLGKMIPLAGGLIGGTADGVSTVVIGKVAKKLFITNGNDDYDVQLNA